MFNRQLSDLIGEYSAINLMGNSMDDQSLIGDGKRLLRWSAIKSQSWSEISLIIHQVCMEKRGLTMCFPPIT